MFWNKIVCFPAGEMTKAQGNDNIIISGTCKANYHYFFFFFFFFHSNYGIKPVQHCFFLHPWIRSQIVWLIEENYSLTFIGWNIFIHYTRYLPPCSLGPTVQHSCMCIFKRSWRARLAVSVVFDQCWAKLCRAVGPQEQDWRPLNYTLFTYTLCTHLCSVFLLALFIL